MKGNMNTLTPSLILVQSKSIHNQDTMTGGLYTMIKTYIF